MYCRHCGQQLTEGMRFCKKCGMPVLMGENKPETLDVYTPDYTPGTAAPFPVMPPKRSVKKTVLIVAAVCAVAAAAVLVPILLNAGMNSRYEQALSLMDSGDIKEARAEFLNLGGYKDAAAKADECQKMLDYNGAKRMMDSGSYEKAAAAFLALGDYEDAEKLAQQCQNTLDYQTAVSLMDSGELEQAQKAFLALGDFEDAAAKAADCRNRLDYDSAVACMNEGRYEDAKRIFDGLGAYLDAQTLSTDCQSHIDYAQADSLAAAGEYYDAYLIFTQLGEFSDAADRALACIQQNPGSGELYRNADYGKKSCAVTLNNENVSDSVYIKIYTADDILVSTVFVNAGQKAKVKLPAGSYRIKKASGVNWFGEKEMFGGEGYYEVLVYEDGTDVCELSSRYIYTLSFGLTEGGNMGGNTVSPEGF